MPSDLRFANRDEHLAWLKAQAALPRGWRVGMTRFAFTPVEVAKPAKMALNLIVADAPVRSFGALFTRNAFPGAPVIIGRQRVQGESLRAILINNKISNVCAPGGVATAGRLCAAAGKLLGVGETDVLPSSTGVIGWQLPEAAMVAALPAAVAALSADSILPVAEGICTTDLYPKIRRADLAGGSIVGIAKGAGMIEPNLGTMLVYLLSDLDVPRDVLRSALAAACDRTFNCLSIDSDTSTSDTVVAATTGRVPCPDHAAFAAALKQVCAGLSEDIVRNGEGVHHVLRVSISGAPDDLTARAVGKSVVNSPLFQCAVAGNDPNVGRLVAAVGKELGKTHPGIDLSRARMTMGGITILRDGAFVLGHDVERALVEHLKAGELYASVPPADGLTFRPPVSWPPHERCVEIGIDLGVGNGTAVVLGADRTHEYISENADYRS